MSYTMDDFMKIEKIGEGEFRVVLACFGLGI